MCKILFVNDKNFLILSPLSNKREAFFVHLVYIVYWMQGKTCYRLLPLIYSDRKNSFYLIQRFQRRKVLEKFFSVGNISR